MSVRITRTGTIATLKTLILSQITVVDNADGTWSVTGPEGVVGMADPDNFQITDPNAIYLNTNTYRLSSA